MTDVPTTPMGRLYKYLKEINYNPNVQTPYIIAITARSGSTMLCDILRNTHLVGEPKEFFNPSMLHSVGIDLNDFEPEQFVAYFDNCISSNSKNGVFGIKLNYFQAKPFIESGVFDLLFPNVKIINLFRRDLIRQAISLELAVQSKRFHSFQEAEDSPNVEFNRSSIRSRIDSLKNDEAGWVKYLDSARYSYLKFFYEDLVYDIPYTVKTIISFLSVSVVDLQDETLFSTRVEKLSNSVNEDFYRLYINGKD